MLEISKHILNEAREILQNNQNSLPARMTSAPLFFVAEENDNTIHAFHAIEHNGVIYKIGTRKA